MISLKAWMCNKWKRVLPPLKPPGKGGGKTVKITETRVTNRPTEIFNYREGKLK